MLKGETVVDLGAGQTLRVVVRTGGALDGFLPWRWSQYWRFQQLSDAAR